MSVNPVLNSFDPGHAAGLHASGQHDALSEYFLAALDSFNENVWDELTPERRRHIDIFLDTFPRLFTREDYIIGERFRPGFVRHNALLANIVSMSNFKTTDAWIQALLGKQSSFIKILTLLNVRCENQIAVRSIFDFHAPTASVWYKEYFHALYGGTPTDLMLKNAINHVKNADPRWVMTWPDNSEFYFFTSYFAMEHDVCPKAIYHKLAREYFSRVRVINRPDKKKIAIVTSQWSIGGAIYRSVIPYIDVLRKDYELTLVQLRGELVNDKNTEGWFSDILLIRDPADIAQLTPLLENEFSLVYFPNIGMVDGERLLSNLRLAPVQVTGYGHPVSTRGAEIDYFIGGSEVEALDRAEENYTERLVTIPGLGVYPMIPESAIPSCEDDEVAGPIIINCAWYAHKFTHTHLKTMREIIEQSGKAVRFRIFAGPGLSIAQHLIPFRRDISGILGEDAVEVVTNVPYAEYQALLNEGAFSLDSYPFGGFNTIIDALVLGKPVVALEGTHAVNRLSSALLRRIGLGDLVATTADEYVSKAVRLANDKEYRAVFSGKVASTDFKMLLCRDDELQAFRRAINYLIENHDRLEKDGSRKPVVIGQV